MKEAQKIADQVQADWNSFHQPTTKEVLLVACALMIERERCAKIASMFSMKPDRSIHPDIPWDQMDDAVKITAHTTAQQIAAEIMGD
jgi:hypothetical protein